jgi:protein AbiQ
MDFYNIDTKYADYLRSKDKQVPHIGYKTHNKFLCGVVLSINGFDYYAPISHDTHKQRTNLIIASKTGRALSSIKFCFMIPVIDNVISRMNFSEIKEIDPSYADLLYEEWDFCNKNEVIIMRKAIGVYNIGCNKSHVLNYTCCDFSLLETICTQYNPA